MTDEKKSKATAAQPPVAFDPVEAALRQIFDDVASEDVPIDFADLVAQLSDKPGKKKDKP
jgi:Anti-sigma factor NepR